jgi:hypothetical protein
VGGSPQGVPIATVIADLLSIQLGGRRSRVLDARKALQDKGSIPVSLATELRGLYAKNAARIAELHAARERARVSMALERNGTGRADLEAVVTERAAADAKRKDDLGF